MTTTTSPVPRQALHGVRIHLCGSIPDAAGSEPAGGLAAFVECFAAAVFNEGATLIHGSHPSFIAPLKAAAERFVQAGGSPDALTLVRATRYASSDEQQTEIAEQRRYAAVEIIPASPGKRMESLVPMREWMAERCDVVVAVGGKWYEVNKAGAGVPAELEEALQRGKPGFVIAGFGGAIADYLRDEVSVLSRLRNGLGRERNEALAAATDPVGLTRELIGQMKLLPLIRGNPGSGRLFRILALDGGGLRGAFTAAVLAQWAQMLGAVGGQDLVKHFDLVAGTSTGAILAIGLGLGLTPGEILTFYREQGPQIFPATGGLRHWLKSKHDAGTLRTVLTEVFHGRRLSDDSCCRLVIPTVRAAHGQAEVIVTAHSPERTGFASYSAVDAALASSAAPTYFDEAVVTGEIASQPYLDGGVWSNNPVLAAIAEAVGHLKIPLERIDVLSVGTLGSEADFSGNLGKGKAGWAPDSADLFFAAQESGAAMLADWLLSQARHLRVNQQTPNAIALDDTSALTQLCQRGSNLGMDTFAAVRSRFLDGFFAPDWRAGRGVQGSRT